MKRMLAIIGLIGASGCADQHGSPWKLVPEEVDFPLPDDGTPSNTPADWLDDPCIERVFTDAEPVAEVDATNLAWGLVHELDHVAETLTAFYGAYEVDPDAACGAYPEPFVTSGKLELEVNCSPEALVMTWRAPSDDGSLFKLEVTGDHSEDTWTGSLYLGIVSDYHNGHGGWGDDGFGNSGTGALECLDLSIGGAAPTVDVVTAGVFSQGGLQPIDGAPIAVRASWEAGVRSELEALVGDRTVLQID